MDEKIRSRLNKKDIVTIPNLLSLFRILLIPPIVLLYCSYSLYTAASLIIIISGLTDIIDGKIARKFNMISDFGKFLDPVADKLTQCAMLFCLVIRYKIIIALIVLMFIKEVFLFVSGCIILRKTNTINSSKWYGKISTFVMYSILTLLFLVPDIQISLVYVGVCLCAIALAGSTILYANFFIGIISASEGDERKKS